MENGDYILVVDDNADNQDLTHILLECEGYTVGMAGDAAQALERLETGPLPRMILMDVQLPGMDGLELTRQLRRDPALDKVVIVALTAYAMKGDEENARNSGCDGYITKPVNTRTFAASVRGFLNKAA